jgi:hypothetical protein
MAALGITEAADAKKTNTGETPSSLSAMATGRKARR